MELSELQQLTDRVSTFSEKELNEQSTKQAFVIPFIRLLGYDPYNPNEVALEYTADYGVKKGENVDIAILKDGNSMFFVECKPLNAKLDKEKCSQLFRYFTASVNTHIGILTNGRQYMFFSDFEHENVMDSKPFMTLDLEHLDSRLLPAIQKLSKDDWNLDAILSMGLRMKRLAAIKEQIKADAAEPSDDLVKRYAATCYEGLKTPKVIEEFRPIVVQAFQDYVSDCMAEPRPEPAPVTPEPAPVNSEPVTPPVATHDSEVQAYVMVKALLGGTVDPSRVVMKDAKTYCSVFLDGKSHRPICRFRNFQPIAEDGSIGKAASIEIMANGKEEPVKFKLQTIDDVVALAGDLKQAVSQYLEPEDAMAQMRRLANGGMPEEPQAEVDELSEDGVHSRPAFS